MVLFINDILININNHLLIKYIYYYLNVNKLYYQINVNDH